VQIKALKQAGTYMSTSTMTATTTVYSSAGVVHLAVPYSCSVVRSAL
jgi:hypothetical protein